MRFLFLCSLALTLTACNSKHFKVPPIFRDNTPTWIHEYTYDPKKHYYIENGISFLLPVLPRNIEISIRNNNVTLINYLKGSGLKKTLYVHTRSKGAPNLLEKEAYYALKIKKGGIENQRRADILAGSIEEQWQKKLAEVGLEAMMEGVSVNDGKKRIRPFKSVYKTPEAQEEKLKKDFYYFFGRKRARLQGLPDNSYQRVIVNNWDCLQTDSFERLNMPLGQYATKLGGGIEHHRSYACSIRNHPSVFISAEVKIASGVEFEMEPLLKPILDSITIDESLPDTHTTFQMMSASKK